MEPKPERLPILIGANGPRMMEVVARRADEWNAWSTPADYPERAAALDAYDLLIERAAPSMRR